MGEDDLKSLLEQMSANVRRHFDTQTESLRGEIRGVAEAVSHLDAKLDREAGALRKDMHDGFAETQAMIKFSHAELDRRVSRLEAAFADLQARVERLETSTQ